MQWVCGRAFHCTIARGGGGEGIFVIITRGRDLPEVPRDSVTVLYIVWEGYGNQSIHNLIEQAKTGICPYAILGRQLNPPI